MSRKAKIADTGLSRFLIDESVNHMSEFLERPANHSGGFDDTLHLVEITDALTFLAKGKPAIYPFGYCGFEAAYDCAAGFLAIRDIDAVAKCLAARIIIESHWMEERLNAKVSPNPLDEIPSAFYIGLCAQRLMDLRNAPAALRGKKVAEHIAKLPSYSARKKKHEQKLLDQKIWAVWDKNAHFQKSRSRASATASECGCHSSRVYKANSRRK